MLHQVVIFKQEEEEKELEGNGGVTKPQSNAASSLPMFHLSGTQVGGLHELVYGYDNDCLWSMYYIIIQF